MSGSNPPRDANGNVLPTAPPVAAPTHLDGRTLATAAVQTQAVQTRFPAPSVPPVTPSQLSPAVTHALDSDPIGPGTTAEHIDARDEANLVRC